MTTQQTVHLVGGTGRTGRRVLEQLLSRGVGVRAIVRSAQRLPADAVKNANLETIEADLLSLEDEVLQQYLRGCDAVISCLGHAPSIQGIFGQPHDLVTQAVTRLCRGIESLQGAKPVKFILMSSVSVNHPGGLDMRRGMVDKAFMGMIRGLVPPAEDNQQAANFLYGKIGNSNPFVQWAVIRPDTLLEGGVSEYTLHGEIVSSLFKPDNTNMANVAHGMCELVTNSKMWADWQGKMPVIINSAPLKK
jgi:hypothetical protein